MLSCSFKTAIFDATFELLSAYVCFVSQYTIVSAMSSALFFWCMLFCVVLRAYSDTYPLASALLFI